MALEPTDDQIRALAAIAAKAGDDPWGAPVANDIWPHIVKALWPAIRDSVLEEAALTGDKHRRRWSPTDGEGDAVAHEAIADLVEDVRAMKGVP